MMSDEKSKEHENLIAVARKAAHDQSMRITNASYGNVTAASSTDGRFSQHRVIRDIKNLLDSRNCTIPQLRVVLDEVEYSKKVNEVIQRLVIPAIAQISDASVSIGHDSPDPEGGNDPFRAIKTNQDLFLKSDGFMFIINFKVAHDIETPTVEDVTEALKTIPLTEPFDVTTKLVGDSVMWMVKFKDKDTARTAFERVADTFEL